MSFRRLELLVRNLPPASRVVRTIAPDAYELAAWGTTDYLLALVADLIGKGNFKNYEPIERPAQAVTKRRRTDERRRALIERYEARQRAASVRGD